MAERKRSRTTGGRFAPKEQVVTETATLGDLQLGNRFVLNGIRYYIAVITDEGVLCMSLIQAKGYWSGGEYQTFHPDTRVEKLNV